MTADLLSSLRRVTGVRAEPIELVEPFDLVVTDIRMPGKSGLDALSELRRAGSHSRFVVITAFPEDATERRIGELDATLLAKPFSLGEFRAFMKTILQPSSPGTGGGA